MTLCLYANWFSPFARKAALGLELKGLPYEAVDALARKFRPQLLELNPRAEVPVLTDEDLVVINSSDILQYLDGRYPTPALYPANISDRVAARALERLADHHFDPIVVDCSLWEWADRHDEPPPGLFTVAQGDMEIVLARLEQALAARPKPWPFGAPGVVECAWFPNLMAARPLGLSISEASYPFVLAWLKALRKHPVFDSDRKRAAAFLKTLSSGTHETARLFWSGDRLAWLMARGFHHWLAAEVDAGRAIFAE